jgi:GNAT superfamily N-acetyltransferase
MLRAGDEPVLERVNADVFDDAIDPAAAREFLADPRHHLAVAVDSGVVVGFASAVHTVHPDKPKPELWVNEVGVAASHHRRGIAKALLAALFDVAKTLGCEEAWVLTSRDNAAANALYSALEGTADDGDTVMYSFRLNRPPRA